MASYVPGASSDVFISYSHIDNQAIGDGAGWVTDFHRRLQIEVEEELGARIEIWRDPRLGPADDFARDLDRRVSNSAMMLAVLSPGYAESAWCVREAKGFVSGASREGDLWVNGKSRLIKVVKRPAPVSPMPEIGHVEFFEADRSSGHNYELAGGSELFNRRLTDLAQEIGFVLRAMRRARTLYLGTASGSLANLRDRLTRELTARRYRVLAHAAPPGDEPIDVRRALDEAALSVFFESRTGSADAMDARARDERRIAVEAGARHVLALQLGDDAQDAGQSPQRFPATEESPSAEVLVDPTPHVLTHTVLQMLGADSADAERGPEVVRPLQPEPAQTGRLVRVYLVCDRPDHPLLQPNRARFLRDHLIQRGFEVKTPLADEAGAAEFSRDNRAKLRQCDGVLIYWGSARQAWFDERLGELMQARGWRRGRTFASVAAYVGDPMNLVKLNYETREVDELIKQFEAFDLTDAKLTRFLDRLAAAP